MPHAPEAEIARKTRLRTVTAMPNALYGHHPSKLSEDRASALPLFGASADQPLLEFVQIGGTSGLPVHAGLPGSMLCPDTRDLFTNIAVGKSLRLFRNNWSRSMLAHLWRSCTPGGTLWVPCVDDRSAERKGFWSATGLRQLFGAAGMLSPDGSFIGFTRPAGDVHVGGDSTLDWALAHPGTMASINACVQQAAQPLSMAAVRAAIAPIVEITASAPSNTLIDFSTEELRGRLEHEIRHDVAAYYIHGVNYKSALIGHILKAHRASSTSLRLCDCGSGPGFLAAELLLDRSSGVTSAVSCDSWAPSALTAWSMYCALGDRLAGRFRFALCEVQDYPFDQQFDVVTFIGSLLYVDRRQMKPTLDRAWQSLVPGGLLIVHENIKAEPGGRDYHLMFTVDELDALLGAYGPIDRYLSTATLPVSAEDAGAKAVFRVIQKRSATT